MIAVDPDLSSGGPDRLDRLAAVWTTLARLLAHAPDAETLDRVRSPGLLAEWPLGSAAGAEAGLAALARSCEASETADAVAADHARLLVGPGRVLVSPYESVHLSEDRLLFEAETLAVRAAYAEVGLAAPRLNREPDDHIALELEFLGTVALAALDAAEAGREGDADRLVGVHDRFLAEHLLRWGPGFFTQLTEAAATEFYRGVGLLGADALVRVGTSA